MKIENQVPVISIKSLIQPLPYDNAEVQATSKLILNAATELGFVYIKDYGVPDELLQELENLSKEFFNYPLSTKMKIKMLLGKTAWRGYFPPGGELTSGIPDAKEGIYFGTELDKDHPKVKSETPLHGSNLWPNDEMPRLKEVVLEYITRLTELGHCLMRGLAIGLKLDENYFKKFFGNDPTILFRIFNYPKSIQKEGWGVGEHTDYGFLTILKTDHNPGLQILSPENEWINAPPIKNTFIINLGDQLEIATQGLLRATPHRVLIQRNENRLSWPFFFDPDWDARLIPVSPDESEILKHWLKSGGSPKRKPGQRWDGKNLHQQEYTLTHGEYLMEKVSKCFPELFKTVVNTHSSNT